MLRFESNVLKSGRTYQYEVDVQDVINLDYSSRMEIGVVVMSSKLEAAIYGCDRQAFIDSNTTVLGNYSRDPDVFLINTLLHRKFNRTSASTFLTYTWECEVKAKSRASLRIFYFERWKIVQVQEHPVVLFYLQIINRI